MARDAADPRAGEYLRRVPKVELHVHLEGALRPARLHSILQRHGLHPDLRGPADLAYLYRHASFAEFLDHFRFAVTSLRDVDDVHGMALDLFRELVAQNVVYAEVIFSASIFTRAGMPLGELLAAVCEAEAAACREARLGAPGDVAPRFNLVIDVVRNFGPESALALVEALGRAAHPRVVGVHLGGDEVRFPARLFGAAFEAARAAGLGRAAHAGEAEGPASVWDALDVLDVQRVGHGIRCVEDGGLVGELVRRGVTLEVCPTSNVRTGIVAELRRHPLPDLLRRGLRVTLGADDPSFFDTDLVGELQHAHDELGIPLETIDACVDAGIEGAFLAEQEKQVRHAELRAGRRALRRELGMPAE